MSPFENAPRLVEVVTGVEQHHNPQPVAAPLFDLVEVAAVSEVWVISFLVGQVRHLDRFRRAKSAAALIIMLAGHRCAGR